MSPPRKRNPENRALPRGWRLRRGCYWFRVPAGQEDQWDGKREFLLGRSQAEAFRTWADRVEAHDRNVRTIGDLLDRYEIEVIPTKRPATARSNQEALPMLRRAFGAMALTALRPRHVYLHMDKRRHRGTGKPARTAALREVEVLSHAFTMAVKWGLMDRHPFKGEVRKDHPPPRDRYVTDEELVTALEVAPPVVRAYLAVKLLTGLRRGDLLRLRWGDVRDDGIHVTTRKTGARIIIEWSDELRQALELARQARLKVRGLTVFATREGAPYMDDEGRASAWKSLWQRYMAKVVDAGVPRFTEHDLRAKTGSDAESLERAREILTHATVTTTRRYYRRKPERVRPLR